MMQSRYWADSWRRPNDSICGRRTQDADREHDDDGCGHGVVSFRSLFGAGRASIVMEVLLRWGKPFLAAFRDSDPIASGDDGVLVELIPGAEGQPHTTIKGAGHFLQEDKGEELARVIVDFIG